MLICSEKRQARKSGIQVLTHGRTNIKGRRFLSILMINLDTHVTHGSYLCLFALETGIDSVCSFASLV